MFSDLSAIYTDPTTYAYNDPKDRKVAIVTGANSGIGYYTVLNLYMHGWIVYMACRNLEKAQEAADKIKQEAEHRKDSLPDNALFGELKITHLDLNFLFHVKEFAEDFAQRESKLDLLINNAGAMSLPAEQTLDGLEVQLQINHVAPFLLTRLLLDQLSQASEPRVVFVSSIGHFAALPGISLESVMSWPFDFVSGLLRYARSKNCVIQTTKVFAQQYPEILFLAVHPGFAIGTRLYQSWMDIPVIGTLFHWVKALLSPFCTTAEEGSHPLLYASLSPRLTTDKYNGRYLHLGPSLLASSESSARYTWDWTEQFLEKAGFLT